MSLLVSAAKFFLEPQWIYASALIIVFLLLYFIRPKPKHQMMPSLMFFFKDLGSAKRTNFLRRLITNLLFLLQLLLLVCLLVAIAKPYINVTKESLFKNTVVVLDASASMKAQYEGDTRFEKAVELAKENLGSINTLIIAKKTPEVALIDESRAKASDYLSKLEATDNPTNLYGAINAAGGYAKQDSVIVVVSDFIDTETDTELGTIKKTLEAQGVKVSYLRVFSTVPNVGIVDLSITEAKTSAVIKNYNAEPVSVKLKINSVEETLNIPSNSKELFSFETPAGTSKLELDPSIKDGFKTDNYAYISAPSDVKKRVLMITNNNAYTKTYIYNAFSVMKNVEVEVAIPPKIPRLSGYDVFIFKDVSPNLILPGTFKGVKEEVEDAGKAAIIIAQGDMLAIDYQGLIPFKLEGQVLAPINIEKNDAESAITADLEFGITKKYFSTSAFEWIKTAKIATGGNDTQLISLATLGNGKLLYYGLLDEDKEAECVFAKSPAYFSFWKRSTDYLTNTPSIKNLNYKTGNYIYFPEEQNIQTPGGRIKTKNLGLDNAGMYTLKDRTIAINLANEKESDVNNDAFSDDKSAAQSSERFQDKVPYELTGYFIIGAIIILLAELLYVKARGDF